MSWTDERVEILKKLWAEGLSASQIATRIGGVTRNAVIGKVHRLGLSGRARPARQARPKRTRPRAPGTSVGHGFALRGNVAFKVAPETEIEPEPEPEPEPLPTLVVAEGEPVTIMSLSERTCRWPIGDPTDDDFRFCGRPPAAGLPYCREHVRVAYQPLQDRRRRKRAAG
jgi:GcrA cell cycle regulator